jgi:hypothetical protein
MYSTCYHCLADLGRNATVEPFPVGRRLAFDPMARRLWAVCLRCGRWNLAPVEEREDVPEQCERLFRAARRRYGTANIALAALADGTELVRVGPALRPELAAWRYGGRLLQARPRAGSAVFRAATAYAAAGARVRRWVTGSGGAATAEERGLRFALVASARHAERVVAVARPDATTEEALGGSAWVDAPVIRQRHLAGAVLVRPEPGRPWRLEIPHETGVVHLTGEQGLRTAAALLAAVNAHGVTPEAVDGALRKLDEAADPDGYFNRVLRTAWRWRWGRPESADDARREAVEWAPPDLAGRLAVSLTGRAFWANGGVGSAERQPLLRTPLVDRLALEMAAHEDAERAVLADVLSALEQAWREAEELARIVDAL